MTNNSADLGMELDNNDLDQAIDKARQGAKLNKNWEPRAKAAFYDPETHKIIIYLHSGAIFHLPVELGEGIATASPAELSTVEVTPLGDGLHWESLDADLSVAGLLAGRFGSRAWMERLVQNRK